ncbi:MAG: choice-of-anchor L domain-containing protein [Planctomycetota bacterium]
MKHQSLTLSYWVGCSTAFATLTATTASSLDFFAPNGRVAGVALPSFDPIVAAESLLLQGAGLGTGPLVVDGQIGTLVSPPVIDRSFAVYENAAGTYDLPATGIALSTGDVSTHGSGPDNEDQFTSGSFFEAGTTDPLNQQLLDDLLGPGIDVFDVTRADLLVATTQGRDKLLISFAFATEEAPEFLGEFTDSFGFFVDGVNRAVIQGSTIGAQEYDEAVTGFDFAGNDVTTLISSGETFEFDIIATPETELDGVLQTNDAAGSNLFRVGGPLVTPASNGLGFVADLNFLIADVGDEALDSTVYLADLRAVFNGDTTLNDTIDADDIDALFDAVDAGSLDQVFDINFDSFIDAADIDALIQGVLGTVYGDLDLDGDVDLTDQWILESHLFQPGEWADGDLDGDGLVTFSDFDILNNNRGFGTGGGLAPLPEPTTALFGGVFAPLLLRRRASRA